MSDHRSDFKELPEDVGLLLLDPRGVGCNSSRLPPQAYRTRYLAADTMAVIHQIKLKNYILYGVSYGTVLATVVAGLAEHSSLVSRPKAVVLTGTLGKAFSRKTWFQSVVSGWDEVKTHLPPQIYRTLASGKLPLGESDLTWGRFIVFKMNEGTLSDGRSELERQLENLFRSDRKSKQYKNTRSWLHSLSRLSSSDESRMFKYISCREIASDQGGLDSDFRLKNGMLIPPHDPAFCKGVAFSPYDSSKWQTSSPIYYIEGDQDRSTPLSQAQYHFENQRHSERSMVIVHGGGHCLARQWWHSSDLKCAAEIWRSVLRGAVSLTLHSCPAHTRVVKDSAREDHSSRTHGMAVPAPVHGI